MPLPWKACYVRPDVIEAVPYDGNAARIVEEVGENAHIDHHGLLHLIVPVGMMPVYPGDYIVRGIDGLIYPVPKAKFEQYGVWYVEGEPVQVKQKPAPSAVEEF